MAEEKITFDDLKRVNETIKTTNIKGKEYAEVNQRIKAFRMLYPQGYIRTEILQDEDGRCTMRAEVGIGDLVLGVGHAYEKESASNINRTSYIENCETSAVGRALGMAGFGIDTSVASAEEVSNAIAQQEKNEAEKKTIDDAKVMALTKALVDEGVPMETVFKAYKVTSLKDLTVSKWKNAMDHIAELKAMSETKEA